MGNPIAALPSFSSSQEAASFSSVIELVSHNNLLMVAGHLQPLNQQIMVQHGQTHQLPKINGADVTFDVGTLPVMAQPLWAQMLSFW